MTVARLCALTEQWPADAATDASQATWRFNTTLAANPTHTCNTAFSTDAYDSYTGDCLV